MNQQAVQVIKYYQENWSKRIADQGVHCLYEETCSHYALRAFTHHNAAVAFLMTAYRLLSCNPINAMIKARSHTHGN